MKLANISEGNYTANITFNGNDKFNGCNLVQNILIKDNIAEVISQDALGDYDSGSFYSPQAGSEVHTGEVNLAPDGHHWKHLGNNGWIRID